MNPLAFSHTKYETLTKGREGSPTYDDIGLNLDYDKVHDSIYQTYNKDSIGTGWNNGLDRSLHKEKDFSSCFSRTSDGRKANDMR